MHFLIPILGLVLPNILFAQPVTLFSIVSTALDVFKVFVRLGLAVALVVFLWGIVKMMIAMSSGGSIFDKDGKKTGSTQSKAIQEGKSRMVWGLVGLFMIVSIWGVIALLSTMVGVNGAATTQPAPIIEY